MRTLYSKFLLVFLPLSIMTFIVISLLSSIKMYSNELKLLHEKMQHTVESQSMIMAEKVWQRNIDQIHLNAASIIADPDVIGLLITIDGGETLESYAWQDVTEEHIHYTDNITYVIGNQVFNVGELTIAFTKDNVVHMVKNIVIERTLSFAVFLLLTLLASYVAYLLTIRKVLSKLSLAFSHSGAGANEYIEWDTVDDDIGRMVDSFNHMQKRTYNYEQKIIEHQNILEQCVEDRTAELRLEISRHKSTQQNLFSEKEKIRTTLESIEDAVLTISLDGAISFCNSSAEEMIGKKFISLGQHYKKVFMLHQEDGKAFEEDPIESSLKQGLDLVGGKNYAVLVCVDGQKYTITYSVKSMHNRQGEIAGIVFAFHDVTVSRKFEQELEYHASHDSLTGLINRRRFDVEIEKNIKNVKQDHVGHWVCYIDLDNFKIVNDTCGHVAGDELLNQISNLIRSMVRREDFIARLGGDEFGVLLINCPIEAATRVMEKIIRAIEDYQFIWHGRSLKIGSSIGMAHIWSHENQLSDVLRHADTACYIAKRKGGNRLHIFHEGEIEVAEEQDQMNWSARINHALEHDGFIMYAQKIEALDDKNKIERYEVLLRMQDENGDIIPPNLFLPAAERFKLSRKIDVLVFDKVFELFKTSETCSLHLSLNITADLFCDELSIQHIVERLQNNKNIARQLCFEITESAAITHMSNARTAIEQLRESGVKIALDDFGAGVSSFGYLQQLPVDYIKIDGQFIRDCVDNPIDQSIVRCIKEVAVSTGKQTVAEYVESTEIKELMRIIGIDYVQGYGIHKPQPLLDLLEQGFTTHNRVVNLMDYQ